MSKIKGVKGEKTEKYFEAVGRRKSASARVRLFKASERSIIVNDKDLAQYFPDKALVNMVQEPFEEVEASDEFRVSVIVSGGGVSAQAESIRLGIARALLEYNEDFKPDLKAADLLKRDPRVKERKKFGLRKARKSPQWSKR